MNLERNVDVTQGRTLGILGGMGPLATAHFYTRLVATSTAISDQDHCRVVIVSDPTIPDRTAFLTGEGADPRPHLAKAAQQLAQLGVDLIVMPCNSASPFVRDVQEAAGVEVVDWVGIAADHARQVGQQPIGIVATAGTLKAQLYQGAFSERNVSFVTPTPELADLTMRAIYGPQGVKTVSSATAPATGDLSRVVEALAEMGARSAILACTELPILARGLRDTLIPLIDPGELVIAELHQWFAGKPVGIADRATPTTRRGSV